MSQASAGTERKRSRRPVSKQRRPRRGGPGMLLTCEAGREVKCEREGLEILQYYLDQKNNNNKKEVPITKLGLDEELAQLRANQQAEDSSFAVYGTSCRGTVFVMCTLPDCALIPSIRPPKPAENETSSAATESGEKRKADDTTGEQESESKRPRIEKEEQQQATTDKNDTNQVVAESDNPPWDPIQTIKQVIKDLEQASTTAPSSRFVTRMIPIQATCFASIEEIQLTGRALLTKYLGSASKPSTFAVTLKRRNCSNVTRDQVVQTLVAEVRSLPKGSEWVVDLNDPAFEVHVEIVHTLCGMSIVPKVGAFRNFNLVEIRGKDKE